MSSSHYGGNSIPEITIEEHDGVNNAKRTSSIPFATKITVDGDNTYIGKAPVGTAQATAGWQCKKIAVSGGTTTITWADGDILYNNIATDLTALSYS